MSSASITERLPVYDELNTSNDSVESIEVPKRRRGPAKVYDFLQNFETFSLAKTFLKEDRVRFKWNLSRRLNLQRVLKHIISVM